MRVAVFGLGYVGVVSAACLADRGHHVIGVDVNSEKVDMLNAGRSPVLEHDLSELVERGAESGRLRATTSAAEAVEDTQLAFVCVGTPSTPAGGQALDALHRVTEQLGALLRAERPYTIVIRSTVLPGTTESQLLPTLEKHSGLVEGEAFSVCVQPEFLREGSSVEDFYHPERTVVGARSTESARSVVGLYEDFAGEVFITTLRVAETVKFVDNAFHAVKVAFANEVGTLAKALDVDSDAVMTIFKADRKLNISDAYVNPGPPFGGSCLPKDLRAVVHVAQHNDLVLPLLSNTLPSNDAHLDRLYRLVDQADGRRVGIFGLAFKPGTDDLRESPMVRLAERLLGKGYDLLIHDAHVSTSHLVGANRAYIEEHLPHLSRLLRGSITDVLAHADVFVLASVDRSIREAIGRLKRGTVIDLVGGMETDHDGNLTYISLV